MNNALIVYDIPLTKDGMKAMEALGSWLSKNSENGINFAVFHSQFSDKAHDIQNEIDQTFQVYFGDDINVIREQIAEKVSLMGDFNVTVKRLNEIMSIKHIGEYIRKFMENNRG